MLIVILYCFLLAINIWFFLIRPKKPLVDRVSLLLQIIGVYTFLFGILAQTEILANFAEFSNDMISSDLYRFLRANFFGLSFLFSADAVALDINKINMSLTILLEPFLLLIMMIFTFIFSFFYIIIILPISYLAYVCASVPVNAILAASGDLIFKWGETQISTKQVVSANIVTVKNLIVAIPSLTISLALKIIQVNESTFANFKIKIKKWLVSHSRVTKIIQRILKITFIIFIVFNILMFVLQFWSHFPIDMTKPGELIGVIIFEVLILLTLFWLYFKACKFHDQILNETRSKERQIA